MIIKEIKDHDTDDDTVSFDLTSESGSSDSDEDSESDNMILFPEVEAKPPVLAKTIQHPSYLASSSAHETAKLEKLVKEKDSKINKLEQKLSQKSRELYELKLQVAYLREDAKAEKSGSTSTVVIKGVAIGAGFALAALATVAALGFLGAMIAPFALPILGVGLLVAASGVGISKIIEHKSKSRDALTVKATLEKPETATSDFSAGIF